MTHPLRPYQLQAVAGIRDAFGQRQRSVLTVLPRYSKGGGLSPLALVASPCLGLPDLVKPSHAAPCHDRLSATPQFYHHAGQ